MLGCGLRRGEIPGIRIDKLDLYNRSLTLIGKGDKERRGVSSAASRTGSRNLDS